MTGSCGFSSPTEVSASLTCSVPLGPAFKPWVDDDELFTQVKEDPETGTITWPNGAELDPDLLHSDLGAAETSSYQLLITAPVLNSMIAR